MLGEMDLNKKAFPIAGRFFSNALRIANIDLDLQNRSLLGLGIASFL